MMWDLHFNYGLRNRILVTLFTLITLLAPAAPVTAHDKQSPMLVRYPRVIDDRAYIERVDYFVHLLKLVLDKSGVKYKLEGVPIKPAPSSRIALMLGLSKYDICWMHSNIEREKMARPVRYPLSKGLLGWRLSFIRKSELALFSKVSELSDLAAFHAGQGHDWPDTPILQSNGLNVTTSINRSSLIAMLTHKRIDYFPRGITEIWDEYAMYDKLDIAIDSNIAFWYPTDDYFFVAPNNHKLADILEKGFEKAIADGSLDAAFNEHFGSLIEKAKLGSRRLFILNNPYLSPETPLQRKELWYRPENLLDSISKSSNSQKN